MIATKNQKTIISKDTKQLRIKDRNYYDVSRLRVRNKTKQTFKDLEWLAKIYPQAIDQKQLLNFIKVYLSQSNFHISMEERTKRVPLGKSPLDKAITSEALRKGREYSKWIQFGDLRGDGYKIGGKGAPLRKEIGKKVSFCLSLLKIAHNSFSSEGMPPVKVLCFYLRQEKKIAFNMIFNPSVYFKDVKEEIIEKFYPKNSLVFVLENKIEVEDFKE